MVLITFKPSLARLLISSRESKKQNRNESLEYLEQEIQQGRWNNIAPIWITPNYLVNGIFRELEVAKFRPTLKPFIVYNGHHRLEKAIEHKLLLRAYIRYTPGNPMMPKEEKLELDWAF